MKKIRGLSQYFITANGLLVHFCTNWYRSHLLPGFHTSQDKHNTRTVDFIWVSGQEGSMTSTSASGRRRWKGDGSWYEQATVSTILWCAFEEKDLHCFCWHVLNLDNPFDFGSCDLPHWKKYSRYYFQTFKHSLFLHLTLDSVKMASLSLALTQVFVAYGSLGGPLEALDMETNPKMTRFKHCNWKVISLSSWHAQIADCRYEWDAVYVLHTETYVYIYIYNDDIYEILIYYFLYMCISVLMQFGKCCRKSLFRLETSFPWRIRRVMDRVRKGSLQQPQILSLSRESPPMSR